MDLEQSIREDHQFSFMDNRMQTQTQRHCWKHTKMQQFAHKAWMLAAIVEGLSFREWTCWCGIITSHWTFSLECSVQKALGKGKPWFNPSMNQVKRNNLQHHHREVKSLKFTHSFIKPVYFVHCHCPRKRRCSGGWGTFAMETA